MGHCPPVLARRAVHVAESAPTRNPKMSYRKQVIILLSISVTVLLAIVVSQTAFDATILRPENNQQTIVFYALSLFISLLFGGLFFVLARNLLKLFAERRLGVLGSKFRTRMVAGALLLSFVPVMVMYWFAYGLMNRSIDKWFSAPLEEVRSETEAMGTLLTKYGMENARAEAASIAASPEIQHAFTGNSFSGALAVFERHEMTLQGGFALALRNDDVEASYNSPAPWSVLKGKLPLAEASDARPAEFAWDGSDYTVGSAPVSGGGLIVVAVPLPRELSQTVHQVQASQARYYNLARERRVLRRTYMGLLLLLTMIVLFVTTWLALFLSKIVTRPLSALAEATQEISRGNLDYRVDVRAADEIGDLVRSFNRMAEDLEASRRQIEASSRDLSAANAELDQRRRHMETILESIPTGVLSTNADRRITHVNQALLRMLYPDANEPSGKDLLGIPLTQVFPTEVSEDFEPLIRRADRMGITTSQVEMQLPHNALNVAVTVATLRQQDQRSGYVVVFEDLSDLLKGQKQAAWREVARRVAHEIKNPLTPIALSAERIERQLDRAPNDAATLGIVRSCAGTIARAVETVRRLVDEFSTLARFPVAKPQPTDINEVVDTALSMFHGRLEGIELRISLAADLPKVMADGEAMKRAVANLVDNAAEALRDAIVREIQVTTALVASRDAVEITIADTGYGVTRELKEKLFLPYFSTKERGTGLGLSIVSRIVEDHHGSIRIDENRPVGTRFIVELPVATDATPVTVTAQHAKYSDR
jgi:two-component system, NtrC family, nitrogen regulation sensor histidine kinase NtrY